MRWLACYDVVDDGRRERLARWLDASGDRLQQSVFMLELRPGDETRVWEGMRACIDLATDKLFLVPLCANCYGRRLRHGEEPLETKLSQVAWVI